jgi:uncharacterized protein (TIGR02996 family)
MPDDPAFIRAIAAAPTDDAPRLIYADVLDERGDEASVARAEFIRVQIEKARLEPRSPRWNELWHRDTELLDWARRWREQLPAIRDVVYGGYIRGFIDKITVTIGAVLPIGLEAVFDAVPVRRVGVIRWVATDQIRGSFLGGGVWRPRQPPTGEVAPDPLPEGTWEPARNQAEFSRTLEEFRRVVLQQCPQVIWVGENPI